MNGSIADCDDEVDRGETPPCPDCDGSGELISDGWRNGRHVDIVEPCACSDVDAFDDHDDGDARFDATRDDDRLLDTNGIRDAAQ